MDTLSQSAMIDAAAHGGAFGNNTHPTPSDAQCKAGNYRVGRLQFHGLPICIEQPRDSVRSGIDPDGASWSCRMAAHYGYISGTKGTDGDAVDCFVGQLPTKNAYIINQFIGSRFDEHKVMLGFDRQESAVSAYLGSYSQGWQGLHSIIPASIEQLSWWLKFGNQSRPVIHDHLPGSAAMTQPPVLWANGLPTNATLDQVLYNMRRDDPDNLLIYPVSVSDILADAEGGTFDALVVQASKAEQKLGQLKMAMERAGGEIKPVAMQITEPFRQNGTTNVAAVIEMDDGQTVSVYLHNPDVTPSKLAPSDALISWRWMLNRRDITIVAAPEKGDDLRPMEVAKRVMALVQKNSPAFKRANERRAANMQEIKSLNDEIGDLEKRKAMLEHQISVREIEISSAPQSKGQYRISNSRKNVVVVTEKDGVLSISVRNKGEKHDMTAKSTAEANAQIAALLGGAELSLSSGSDLLGNSAPDLSDSVEQTEKRVRFEHAGFHIYPINVNVKGHVESMWAVQSIKNKDREQRGERQVGGDSLHSTKEQAMAEAEFEVKRMENDSARNKKLADKERASAEAKAERLAMFADFVAHMGFSAIQAENARNALLKSIMSSGKQTTIKDLMDRLVSEGRVIGEYGGKRTLEEPSEGGWMLEEKKVGKTAFDYAEYLISKRSNHEQELGSGIPAAPLADQDPQATADREFIQSAIDGKADFYDKAVTDRLADLAKQYTDGDMVALLKQAKTAAKNFFMTEFQKKAA